jgi:hypothetical protein
VRAATARLTAVQGELAFAPQGTRTGRRSGRGRRRRPDLPRADRRRAGRRHRRLPSLAAWNRPARRRAGAWSRSPPARGRAISRNSARRCARRCRELDGLTALQAERAAHRVAADTPAVAELRAGFDAIRTERGGALEHGRWRARRCANQAEAEARRRLARRCGAEQAAVALAARGA